MFTRELQPASGGGQGPDNPVKIALVPYPGFSPNNQHEQRHVAAPSRRAPIRPRPLCQRLPSSCATGPGGLFLGGGSGYGSIASSIDDGR
jgi:hypothetical protein